MECNSRLVKLWIEKGESSEYQVWVCNLAEIVLIPMSTKMTKKFETEFGNISFGDIFCSHRESEGLTQAEVAREGITLPDGLFCKYCELLPATRSVSAVYSVVRRLSSFASVLVGLVRNTSLGPKPCSVCATSACGTDVICPSVPVPDDKSALTKRKKD